MSIKRFIEELAEALEARNEGLRAVPTEMQKNNGIIQNGLCFYRAEEKVAPIFWLNQFYERFKKGELLKENILERIIREYKSLPTPNIPDMEEWMGSPEFLSQICEEYYFASRGHYYDFLFGYFDYGYREGIVYDEEYDDEEVEEKTYDEYYKIYGVNRKLSYPNTYGICSTEYSEEIYELVLNYFEFDWRNN